MYAKKTFHQPEAPVMAGELVLVRHVGNQAQRAAGVRIGRGAGGKAQ